MRFRILGPLSVTRAGRDATPTAPKVRQVLAFLLVHRNQLVQVSEFVDELWGDQPPDSVMTTLQTYIYKLRKDVLDPAGPAHLRTRPSGYVLEIPEEELDSYRFEHLAAQGRLALEDGDPLRATELLAQALGLWRGRALVGVVVGGILAAHVTRLEEKRLRALELRIEADMLLGRCQELVSELKQLVCGYPLHERFHGDLMVALNRSGRRYEALQVYRQLRALLIEELGLEPSASLQRLHQQVLSAPASGEAGYPRMLAVPAQLPPDISDFTGREEALRQVREQCDGGTTARTVSICGMAGVGKTSLALRAAHLDRTRYPDGQLFADLRGASPNPAAPADVLAGFLRAVGVPPQEIPATLEERSKLFRTWNTGRRVLIVLDDAKATSQVAALLPATPDCAVLITSRWSLQGLPGARTLELEVMAPAESLDFLVRMVGRDRVAAEMGPARDIADLCGHLPLALRCAGARLATMRTWPLQKMATLLRQSPSPLDQFRYAGYDIRAGYDASYDLLPPHDRSTFRFLGMLPPQQFTAATAAGFLGSPTHTVETQLNRLVDCHLLSITTKDATKETHYQLHRLTRYYARERLNLEPIRP